eukprot:CAMPEP_0171058660 /NCGR_PEP_ID=MMETSP0766_2-20121228/2646_1 /TAXON_ID=439317 /ORGANISM="Gambierdiscus australes, Strain CAWD 149" /LENGTH=57 /DNA_ID=CAMNT_0011513969 /DNA_START=107 /DNA_END=277 /DNA_ORIENTATION=+
MWGVREHARAHPCARTIRGWCAAHGARRARAHRAEAGGAQKGTWTQTDEGRRRQQSV